MLRTAWICLLLIVASLLPSLALSQQSAPSSSEAPPSAEAAVEVFNRTVTIFRGSFLGVGPTDRARRTQITIDEELERRGAGVVQVESIPQGRVITLDGRLALILTPADTDPLRRESLDDAAAHAAAMLRMVLRETREAHDIHALLKGLGIAAAVSAALLALLWITRRVRDAATRRLLQLADAHVDKLQLGGEALIRRERLVEWLSRGLQTVYWVLVLLVLNQWVGIVLGQFPYTRPWGERLNHFLAEVLLGVFGSIAHALPNLLIALLVFLIARWIVGALHALFDRISSRQIELPWFDPDTATTTRRLAAVGVWLFALAMAYPYLPGAQTEAFKGLSVLVGLMVSLGASSLVGQGASGLILIYTRTLRVGEYVKIGQSEGTVVDIGMFSTRIRTGLGEEIVLSNSQIINSVTTNYSRTVQGPGYVLDCTVTIGYDAPWRQVEALLITAAQRTPGVLATPAPQVFQTALQDFYVEYRLVCQAIPSRPEPRAKVMSALHAHIQDVFNEHGVQIMSPHYLGDPAQAKVVPPSDWYPPPAQPPQS